MTQQQIVCIAGGIGAGKSVVSNVLKAMRYPVYDCDSRAKALMDSSPGIKARISREILPEAINPDGSINRKALADEVFANSKKLQRLNAIVHAAVIDDIKRWAEANSGHSLLFVESAIPRESGLDKMCHALISVEAPLNIRVDRVTRRNNCSPDQVRARIASQQPTPPHPNRHIITNDGTTPIMPQLLDILSKLAKQHPTA